jgi:hypothetical protein
VILFEVLAGIVAAISMILWARTTPNSKYIYNLSLLSLPAVYIGFAIYSDVNAVMPEIIWGIPFFAAPLLFLFKSRRATMVILALLYLLHGGYDLYHGILFNGSHVPAWYATFCASLDFVVGAYLLLVALANIDSKLQYA